jgi:hypothetical protein
MAACLKIHELLKLGPQTIIDIFVSFSNANKIFVAICRKSTLHRENPMCRRNDFQRTENRALADFQALYTSLKTPLRLPGSFWMILFPVCWGVHRE